MCLRVVAVSLFAVMASALHAQAQTTAAYECRSGRFYVGKTHVPGPPGGDELCGTHKGYDAVGLAINVPQTSYASTDNPACNAKETDAITKAVVQLATAVAGGDEDAVRDVGRAFDQLKDQCSGMGGDLAQACRKALGLEDKSACQPFILVSPRPAAFVTFWGSDNQQATDAFCYDSSVSDNKPNAAVGAIARCRMGASGWTDLNIVPKKRGNGVVATAIFKNWSGSSNISRTGTMWIWYRP